MRMLQVWDNLAERYNKPLDEDDIVDLRDLSFLKDRGVTRAVVRTPGRTDRVRAATMGKGPDSLQDAWRALRGGAAAQRGSG